MIFDLVVLVTIALTTVLIYRPGLHGQFVLDDNLILKNKRINGRFPGRQIENSPAWHTLRHWWVARNLTLYTYERDALCHPIMPEKGITDSWGWHATNLAIHATDSVLVYGLARRWFDPLPSLLGALIFVLHPVATGVAEYIAGRSSGLCCLFFLIALIGVASRTWSIVLLGFIGAYASKEEWMALPVSAVVVWWFT